MTKVDLNMSIDLDEVVHGVRGLSFTSALCFVRALDEARADIEFTKALFEHCKSALAAEGVSVDESRTQLQDAVQAIRDVLDRAENSNLRTFRDRDGDRWYEIRPGRVVMAQSRESAVAKHRERGDIATETVQYVVSCYGAVEVGA